MQTVLRTSFFLLFILLFGASGVSAAAMDEKMFSLSVLNGVSLGFGAEFETGDYGGETTLDSLRIPFLIDWIPTPWLGLSLEIPYLRQTSSSETVSVGGRRMPRRGETRTTTSTAVRTETHSESGLGDVTLDVNLRLLAETDTRPGVGALIYVKIPTADEEKGLGTGEFDRGAGLRTGKIIGDWSVRAKALYVQPGTSALYDPDAYWDWSTSLSYLGNLSLRPGIGVSGGTAAFEGEDDPLEISARLGILKSERTSLSLSLARGLSDASPDWRGGIFCFFDF